MNIVSSLVGLTIAGTAMPMVADMTIAPFVAQKRATNFGIAESRAVAFAATNEGQDAVASAPTSCNLEDLGDRAYKITCEEGVNQFTATATRAFKLKVEETDGASGAGVRSFGYNTPSKFGVHQCPSPDPWGVNSWNNLYESALGACIPQVAWTRATYRASDPNSWLFDINNYNGWGHHEDY